MFLSESVMLRGGMPSAAISIFFVAVRFDIALNKHVLCVCRSLPREALTLLVTSFFTSKIDNCNVVLAGLPQRDLDRIQFVLNAAARLTADARKFDHM